jgi:hypothetical protein
MEPTLPSFNQRLDGHGVVYRSNKNDSIRAEVQQVLHTFIENMNAYYSRTGNPKKCIPYVTMSQEFRVTEPTSLPLTATTTSTTVTSYGIDLEREMIDSLTFGPSALLPQLQLTTNMQARFALQAAAHLSRQENTQIFTSVFEEFAAEMRRNFAAQSQRNMELEKALKIAEQKELALYQAFSNETAAYKAEIAQLKARQNAAAQKNLSQERRITTIEQKVEQNKGILDNHTHRISGAWGGGIGYNPDVWQERHTFKRDIHGPENERRNPT